MGSIYRPKYRAADDTLKESAVIWIKYRDALGVLRRESTETTKEQEAKRFLKQREGAAVEGRVIVPRADKITFAQLAQALRDDYKANARKSVERLELSLAHLTPAFGAWPAARIGTADVTAYTVRRQEAGAANASVNRELAAMKRAFSLAVKGERLQRMPYIPMLKENNVRKGFVEPGQLDAIQRHLPKYAQAPISFAYITGWRLRSEVLRLQWRQVDFRAGVVTLDVGATKSGHGRTFPLTAGLRALLEAQRTATDEIQKRKAVIIPFVFHRRGRPMKGLRKAWKAAVKAAGLPGLIPHDLRRSCVRNLERAGVPRSTAMALVGHKTQAIYSRYAVTDEAMLREGTVKLAAYLEGKVLGTVEGSIEIAAR
jgi:integrase